VTVKDGKAIAQDGAIAGSTLNLLDGLKNYAAFCGLTLEEAIPAATINPARCAGIADSVGSLEVGKYADFLVLSADRREHLATAVGGELIWK
jgi:N-acetylglucosamine-6-phosphate deacetylase